MRMRFDRSQLHLAAILLLLMMGDVGIAARPRSTKYAGSNNAASTPGGKRFDAVLGVRGALSILSNATAFVQSTLGYGHPSTPEKHVQLITFALDVMDGIAYTSGDAIHLSASYVAGFSAGDVVAEIRGILFHEMTHVWQWDGRGSAPGGLIEGVADFVRLRADLAPAHWVKPGAGDRWDQGYDVTARFLDYVDRLQCPGFVALLNAKLATGWSESYFVDLTGKSVQSLWSDYKKAYRS